MIIGLIFGLSGFANAQGTSNKGTDFWVAYGNHVAGYSVNIGQDMVVYITSDLSTSGQLEVGTTTIPFTVTANAITTVTVPQSAYIGNNEGKVTGKGIHITSVLPIVVYAHIYDQSVSGATLVLPTNTLGKDYYSLNYEQMSNSPNSHSFFFVVATEDDTEIIITPSVDTQGGLKANVPSSVIKLQKGEIYQVFGKQTSIVGSNTKGTDLTGTRIQSVSSTSTCKKIAVFSGSGKIGIGCLAANGSVGSSDNLFQQVYPTASWGKTFVTVPSKERNYDVYRIFKSDPNAVVKLNGNIIPSANFVNNFYYEFPSQEVNYVESDKAIQVALYAVTQGKSINCTPITGDVGDPEMIYLNSLEQTLSQITMYSTQFHMILKHFINIVIPQTAASSFTIDGVSYASYFQTVAGKPDYAYAQIPVNAGTHNLKANAGFNAIAYGFGNAESYGYAAGANVKGLGVEIRRVSTSPPINTICVNEQLNLSVKFNSTVSKLTWDLGDGSPPQDFLNPVPINPTPSDGLFEYLYPNKVSYSVIKDYKIIVTADKTSNNGCGSIEVTELQFSVISLPSASFTSLNEVCAKVPITFTDASVGNGKIISKWQWDFGDGNLSSVQNPTHTFATAGDYIVKLMVEGETGCLSDVFSQTVHVIELPKVNFKYSSPSCASEDITFNDLSTTAEGAINKWIWNFGDGSADETRTDALAFTHKYSTAGTYKVSLKVFTDKTCESVTFEKNVQVYPLPVVDFELPEICIKDTFAQFTDLSTIADGSALSYLWDFGDPTSGVSNTSSLKNPTHIYTVAGIYPVKLTVTTSNGCITVAQKQFTVSGAVPDAKFSVLNSGDLCSNREVVFRNLSTVNFGNIAKIEWFFDDGVDMTFKLIDENPVFDEQYKINYPVFSSPATKQFKVRMLAYSGGICFDEEIQIITLKAAPEVIFTNLSDICQEAAPFLLSQASEKNAQAGVGVYSGNGVTASGFFNPALAGPGIHTIKYVFTSSNGCSDSNSKDILVMPTPTVSAGRDTVILEGGSVKLQGIASGSNLTYKWLPSIGLSSDDVLDPVADPINDVTYILTVTSDQGCVSMDEIKVKVLKAPIVPNAFSPNGDGVNDSWNIKYLESYANATVTIFSRYGSIVYYSSKGYSQPWTGQANGSDLPMGTYYYIIDPKTVGRKLIAGDVTIIR